MKAYGIKKVIVEMTTEEALEIQHAIGPTNVAERHNIFRTKITEGNDVFSSLFSALSDVVE